LLTSNYNWTITITITQFTIRNTITSNWAQNLSITITIASVNCN